MNHSLKSCLCIRVFVAAVMKSGYFQNTPMLDTRSSRFKSPFARALKALLCLGLMGSSAVQTARAINPADGNATQPTRNVLNYIKSLESANQILTVQQVGNPWILTDLSAQGANESEITRINQLTGKYPAMIALDWLNCDAYSSDHGPSVVQLAKNYWNSGGLISFCWHEGNPHQYSPDNSETAWSSFSASDWNDLLNNPNSAIHNNWLHHMSLVAGWLGQLRDAGVVVAWRPLHEGEGSWFWWGNSPANYQALWRMEFNLLVNTYGLHNMIWVFSSGPNSQYYPGANYVDVAGQDIYSTSTTDATYQNTYNTLKGFVGDRATAVTESGLLPDINYLHNMRYTWLLTWWGKYMDRDYYGASGEADCNTGAMMQNFYNDYRTIDRAHIVIPSSATPILSGHTYILRARNSGKCAEIANAVTGNGGNVDQFQIWNPAATCQRWTAYGLGGGFWKFINANSGRALEVTAMSTTPGGNIQQWDWNGATCQSQQRNARRCRRRLWRHWQWN